MSGLLNQKCTFTKLRVELEGRKERMCWYYRKFGHLVHNYRNKRGEIKGKLIPQNKFEIIASRVIQCRVGRKIKVRRQETVEKVKCFRCWEVGHYKWKYLNIEKRRKSKEKTAHVARPQKAQQERRPMRPNGKRHRNIVGRKVCPLKTHSC